jgi:hypothetical protein
LFLIQLEEASHGINTVQYPSRPSQELAQTPCVLSSARVLKEEKRREKSRKKRKRRKMGGMRQVMMAHKTPTTNPMLHWVITTFQRPEKYADSPHCPARSGPGFPEKQVTEDTQM